ncbi:MAG TPA: metal ABC transporter permease [Verrucomicrobiae bacterium]|nr:metal ABC transporter permease [Verrucomicrobiae bacterium]
MNIWHQLISRLPFEWTQFAFMRTALLAVLIVSPLFALIGTLVVNNRMAFFSDAIGHASLTGVALGVLLGLGNPIWSLLGFGLILGWGIISVQRFTRSTMDTVISLSMSFSIALGVTLLSRGGNFAKFNHYLIGDLLSITPAEVGQLLITTIVVGGGLLLAYNRILLVGLNESLARSRGLSPWWTQVLFCSAVVMVVVMNLNWVGLLIINSLLIVPAAGARNLANNARQYVLYATAISLFSGVTGLVGSYYANTATGASIVLAAICCFLLSLGIKAIRSTAAIR